MDRYASQLPSSLVCEYNTQGRLTYTAPRIHRLHIYDNYNIIDKIIQKIRSIYNATCFKKAIPLSWYSELKKTGNSNIAKWLHFNEEKYLHDQSRHSIGHGIDVLQFKMNAVTGNCWLIYAAAMVIYIIMYGIISSHWV